MADGGDDVGRPTVVGMPAERGSSASRSRAAVDHESGRFTRCARALTTATCCRAPCQPIHAEAGSRSLAKHSERRRPTMIMQTSQDRFSRPIRRSAKSWCPVRCQGVERCERRDPLARLTFRSEVTALRVSGGRKLNTERKACEWLRS